MSHTKPRSAHTYAGGIVSLLLVLFSGWLLLNRQYVIDQISVWQFSPSSEVVAMAERSGMSDGGKFYLYASRSAVNSQDEFNKNCTRKEVGSAILGCYANGNIYIYAVTNARLDGIREVTAVHEMLHAAWDRMNDGDKEKISVLLEAEAAKVMDTSLKERLEYYSRTEPGERANELHSIIGTEVADLGSELEAHYAKYFADRQKTVKLHAQYQTIFNELATKSEELVTELNALVDTINVDTEQYNEAIAVLVTDKDAFNARANTVGGFASVAAFNTARAALLTRISTLTQQRAAIDANMDAYKAKYAEYQELAVQSQELNKSLDSTLSPAPAQL